MIDTVSRIQNTLLVILPSSNTFGLFSDLQTPPMGGEGENTPLCSMLSRESQSGDPQDREKSITSIDGWATLNPHYLSTVS